MTTMDGRLPAPDSDEPAQPIGRVNLRSPDTEDLSGSWSLRAILFGVLAIAVMLLTLMIVLPWALEPLPA
jgi:hypothetical protein